MASELQGSTVSFADTIANAAKSAACDLLSTYGAGAPALAAVALFEPSPVMEVAALTAGIAAYAAQAGCSWDPGKEPPSDGPNMNRGCESITGGTGTFWLRSFADPGSFLKIAQGVVSVSYRATADQFYDIDEWVCTYANGSTTTHAYNRGPIGSGDPPVRYGELTADSGTCNPMAPGPVPAPGPHTYVENNCTYVVEFQSWAGLPGGNVAPVFKISAGDAQSRASGGVIGGCNFNPVIHMPDGGGGGGGGNGPVIPWLPGDDGPDGEPWWADAIRGLAQAAGAELLRRLFEERFGGAVYRVVSVCETNEAGDPVSQAREIQIPAGPSFEAVISRLDGLAYVLQGLKDFKQPICPTDRASKPVLTGEWVSVNFQSDEASPGGERPLRKELRYRDQTAAPLETHLAHWESFAWDAGPVIVVSKNLSWGEPKVWAASIAEGKRVISHAAQVAGVDLTDPKHEWLISGSRDPRYGRTGRMRVDTRRGTFMRVTKRAGPSGLPSGFAPDS